MDDSYGSLSEHSMSPLKLIDRRKIIVNYLPSGIREDELGAMFSKEGEVTYFNLVRDTGGGASHCYGFVEFAHERDATRAILRFNGTIFRNKSIKVSHARPHSPDIKGANLYVLGIPKNVSEDQLSSMFDRFGRVIHVRILYDFLGRHRGAGFIRLDTRENAIKGKEWHNKTRSSDNKGLTVAFAKKDGFPIALGPRYVLPNVSANSYPYKSCPVRFPVAKLKPTIPQVKFAPLLSPVLASLSNWATSFTCGVSGEFCSPDEPIAIAPYSPPIPPTTHRQMLFVAPWDEYSKIRQYRILRLPKKPDL
jgi:hypothetical protein